MRAFFRRQDFFNLKVKRQQERRLRLSRQRKALKLFRRYHPGEKKQTERPAEYIPLPKDLFVSDDNVASALVSSIDRALANPLICLDLRKVETISLRAGLLLKSYCDEYRLKYHKRPLFRSPLSQKSKAVLQYLEIRKYGKLPRFNDLVCWRIYSFKQEESENVGRLLVETIIPECLAVRKEDVNKPLASAVQEALFNCKEHAYHPDSFFKTWYLGYGLHPNSKEYTFCVCDKGMGFKESMNKKWKMFASSDSKLIQQAARGQSGISDGSKKGRGQGLKTAIESLKQVQGRMGIMSGRGWYQSGINRGGEEFEEAADRKTEIHGSIIDFSIPIKYIAKERKR